MIDSLDIEGLKELEKGGKRSDEGSPAGKKGKKGKGHKAERHDASCGWQGDTAAGLGLSLLAVGGLALAAVLGAAVDWWALFLLLPGTFGLASGLGWARRKPGADWIVWPLIGGLTMTVGGLAWALGASWQTMTAAMLIGIGLILVVTDGRRRARR